MYLLIKISFDSKNLLGSSCRFNTSSIIFMFVIDTNYDEAIMEQQKAIENEVVSSQNIISLPEDLSSLEKEYNADDAVYLAKIQVFKNVNYVVIVVRCDRSLSWVYVYTISIWKASIPKFDEPEEMEIAFIVRMALLCLSSSLVTQPNAKGT